MLLDLYANRTNNIYLFDKQRTLKSWRPIDSCHLEMYTHLLSLQKTITILYHEQINNKQNCSSWGLNVFITRPCKMLTNSCCPSCDDV